MFLKNYTSEVPVFQTITRIEKVLIQCGVLSIEKEYGPAAEVSAIRFKIPGPTGGTLNVRLPADKDRAQDALWLNYADGAEVTSDGKFKNWQSYKKKTRKDFAQQAERTAWKIVQDWVEVQMSMVQLRQAEAAEVFMPYVWDGKASFFQRVKAANFPLLLNQNT